MAQIRHVALLRGINVGGKNVIPMSALRARFEAMGFSGVETYIQSGNVLFSSPRAGSLCGHRTGSQPAHCSARKDALTKRIERDLGEAFDYASSVVLVLASELERVVAEAPPGFGKEPERYRYDVLFVKEPMTAREALEQVPTKPGVDAAHAGTHALYFRRLIAKDGQSLLPKLLQKPVIQHITIRNWNTTTRLLALVKGSA